ncbi:uncharacterized protein isoform X2 [Rhodnius prolixus]|uniref:uncharacterized protein isoform X2 n=1 Tax=Rhodnius prolixus TaxID=13249 RepID=UPI003D18E9C6
MCSFLDDSELKSVKYPRYLRKKQKLKLKLNDVSVNNQSPDLKVLPYVPDVRLDVLSMSNNQGNKGRLVNINKSDNKSNNSNVFKKKDNKIIYRLPTPNDILRSKNVNVPKVKKIDRNVLKRINNRHVLKNENSQVNKDSPMNRNEKTEVNPSIAITSHQNAVNKSATNKLYESLKTNKSIFPPSTSNIDHEIDSAWAKFKEDESWNVKMKEMVTKQISIDSKRLKNNAKKVVSLNDIEDSIEHVEEIFEMKLVDETSIVVPASFSSNRYGNDHSNIIYMNTIVETNKETNDSDVSQENISSMKIASQIDEYDKSSNETFIVSIDHLNEESNLESPTLTYSLKQNHSFIEDFTLQTRTEEEDDAVLKSSTNKEEVTYTSDSPSSNHLSDHILDEKSDRDNDDFSENHTFMNEDLFVDIFKPTNTEKVNDIINDFLDSVTKTKSQLIQDYMSDKRYNAEHKENNYNQNVLQTSNWILNTSSATKLPCESLETTFLEIMNDVEGIYENIQSCGDYNDSQFSPWTYLDSTNIDEDYAAFVTNNNFHEKSNRFNSNKIIELSDSEYERQIEESNYIVRNTNKGSLSVIHKKELNQYKIIYNGRSTVYTIFNYLHSFLFCVPLFLTMNISLNAVSTICNFSRESDRNKRKRNQTTTNTNFGKKFILLPLRKFSQISAECEMKTELDKTHSVIRSSENLIFKESHSNHAINIEYSLEQSSNLVPNSDDQLYLNLHPLNTEEDNTLTTRIEDVIAKQEDSKSDSFSLDTPEYYFEKENGSPHKNIDKYCSFYLRPRNDSSMEHFLSSDNEYNSTDHVCDNSSDESIWGDNESKYFASCSSAAYSDVDYNPERYFNYYYPITYSTDKDNFTVHKKKIEYYEKIEYKKDPLDYQTVKTNFAKLPLLNNQYDSNKEYKRNWNSPPYSSKWIENRTPIGRVPKKNRTSKPKAFEKLPPLVSRIIKQSTSDDQPETMDKLSGDKRSVGNTTIDSAYSSLTRVLSEGGGGGGFSGGGGKDTFKLEQSRFCHECGTQYPVAVAKFCCYCGMRRIAI